MIHREHEPLWQALPQVVPQSAWEKHLVDIHSALEDILQRTTRLEEQGRHHSSQLVELHRKCRDELATKQALTEARVDLDMCGRRLEMEEGLDAARKFAASEVAAAWSELGSKICRLESCAQTAGQELERLDAVVKAEAAHGHAAYATRNCLDTACAALREERNCTVEELRGLIQNNSAKKASRQELEIIQKSLQEAHDALLQDHGETTRGLAQVTGDHARLEKHSHEQLATRIDLEDAQRSLAAVKQQMDQAAEDRKTLREHLEYSRTKLDQTSAEQSEQMTQLASWMQGHIELNRGVQELGQQLGARCDLLAHEVGALDRREQSAWDQFMNGQSGPPNQTQKR